MQDVQIAYLRLFSDGISAGLCLKFRAKNYFHRGTFSQDHRHRP